MNTISANKGGRVLSNKTSARLFITPAILFFVMFIAYPVIFIVYGSLFEWSTLANMNFVGFSNYAELLKDSVFGITLKNSFYWVIITVLVQMIIGFFLAFIIEECLSSHKGLYRTVFFIPVVTSVVAIAILFKNMFSPYQGLITNALYSLGYKGIINWLGDTKTAIFAVIAVNIWEWTGWSMVLYIAGISQIPNDVKEAADIDGASGIKKIFSIYLPLLAPTHKSLVMLGIIGSLQTFALVYSMTNGGPNNASQMPGTYIFRTGFTIQKMGYASAISVVILLIALVLTVAQVVTLGSGNFVGKGVKK
ncbi:MAG: sugar ABC transporter permease [Christensenellaceae bacterium]|nr:sugar ABC transporter permease [Christensenellaceae bacterium]